MCTGAFCLSVDWRLVAREVRGNAGGCFGHGILAFLPVRGANFAVRFVVNPSVEHADGFVDVAADGEEVHELVTHDAFFVNQEESPICDEVSVGDQVSFFVLIIIPGEDVIIG